MSSRPVKFFLLAGLATVLGAAGYLFFAAAPEAESLAMPQTATTDPLATKGVAAFAGAGFGGISLTSLEIGRAHV